MTPQQLDNFHAWLFSSCPATADTLLRELEVSHRTMPEAMTGLPKTSAELTAALKALAIAGRVENRGGDWHWLNVERREEAKERRLFA